MISATRPRQTALPFGGKQTGVTKVFEAIVSSPLVAKKGGAKKKPDLFLETGTFFGG